MNIYFRTNYNIQQGIGNFMRAVTLATKLQKNNFCTIILDKKIDKKKFKNLNLNFDYLYNDNYQFKSEVVDAKKFSLRIKKNSIIIVDDYRIGDVWEKIVTKNSKKLVAICDNYKKKHYVDFLINTKPLLNNPNPKIFNNIKNNNKRNCSFLLGHKYAFIKNSSKIIIKKKKPFTITFYNGGSSSLLIYSKLIKLIISNEKLINKKIQIKVIVGPLSQNIKSTLKVFSKIKRVKIIKDKLDLGEELVNTDLMVSSAGLIFYESTYYKIPTIFIKMVNNQDIDNYAIQNFGQIMVLTKKDLMQTNKMGSLIVLLINNYKRITEYLSKPNYNIDGNGPSRIAKKILR